MEAQRERQDSVMNREEGLSGNFPGADLDGQSYKAGLGGFQISSASAEGIHQPVIFSALI